MTTHVGTRPGRTPGTREDLRASLPLFVGIGLLTLGNGLQGTLLGVRATIEGFPTVVTGLVMAAYYVGYVVGSVRVPAFIQTVGHIRVFAALASMASTAILLHGQFPSPIAWAIVRFVSGLCLAGLFVVIESWLNDQATNETRGRMMSIYMVVLMAGVGGGQVLLNIADPSGFGLFVLTSILLSVALVPVSLAPSAGPPPREPEKTPVRALARLVPLAVAGCVVSGLAYGMLFSMGPVYAQAAGLSVRQVSAFMTAAVLGAMLLQIPIGHLSDRGDRRLVIAATSILAGAAAIVVALLTGHAGLDFLLVTGLFGGLALPLYSLSIAHANDYLRDEQRVAASATLLLIMGIGLTLGPLVAAASIETVGAAGFFWVMAVVHGALGIYTLYRRRRRRAAPEHRRWHYLPVPARASAMATAAFSTLRRPMRDRRHGERRQNDRSPGGRRSTDAPRTTGQTGVGDPAPPPPE